jgi:hypothetical protein
MNSQTGLPTRPFQFDRDTFTFANELIWEYEFNPVTGAMKTHPCDPPATYTHRCFVLVRAARQFFYHARFEPGQPVAEEQTYRQLIREVVSRNPRRASPHKIVIPGYDCLRAFSRAQAALLKAGCGRAWQSYFIRSHWRMVAPTTRGQQEQMACQLLQAMRERPAPPVHLYCFPSLRINHGILLFGATESDRDIQFDAYDPNVPEHPVKLIFERAARTFTFPRARYWPGGPLNVFEQYVGGLY